MCAVHMQKAWDTFSICFIFNFCFRRKKFSLCPSSIARNFKNWQEINESESLSQPSAPYIIPKATKNVPMEGTILLIYLHTFSDIFRCDQSIAELMQLQSPCISNDKIEITLNQVLYIWTFISILLVLLHNCFCFNNDNSGFMLQIYEHSFQLHWMSSCNKGRMGYNDLYTYRYLNSWRIFNWNLAPNPKDFVYGVEETKEITLLAAKSKNKTDTDIDFLC